MSTTNCASNYPAGMSDCFQIGMGGGCGLKCPVLLRGDCEEEGMRAEAGLDRIASWFAPAALAARREGDNPSHP